MSARSQAGFFSFLDCCGTNLILPLFPQLLQKMLRQAPSHPACLQQRRMSDSFQTAYCSASPLASNPVSGLQGRRNPKLKAEAQSRSSKRKRKAAAQNRKGLTNPLLHRIIELQYKIELRFNLTQSRAAGRACFSAVQRTDLLPVGRSMRAAGKRNAVLSCCGPQESAMQVCPAAGRRKSAMQVCPAAGRRKAQCRAALPQVAEKRNAES